MSNECPRIHLTKPLGTRIIHPAVGRACQKLFWAMIWFCFFSALGEGGSPILVFPQFASGEVAGAKSQTRLVLRNGNDSPTKVVVQFKGSDGTPVSVPIQGVSSPEFSFSLSPWGTLDVETDGTEPFQTGVIEIVQDKDASNVLRATEIIHLFGNFIAAESSVESSSQQVYASVSEREVTGIAVFNPDRSSERSIDLYLLDRGGIPQASGLLRLGPGMQVAQFIDEDAFFEDFFSNRTEDFTGTLILNSREENPFHAVSLLQNRNTGSLVFNPASHAEYSPPGEGEVERLSLKVLAEYPHDPHAFTQGLVWEEGKLYESTGLYGQSTLRLVDLASGKALFSKALPSNFFGEGLAKVGDRLIQLTWLRGIALVYDSQSFEVIDQKTYEGEGWGLTYNGQSLIMSDGSSSLTFRDPDDFELQRTVRVTRNGKPVYRLNELEWVDGAIFANIWQKDEIVRIDPDSGRVTGVIDTSSLPYSPKVPGHDVLNGIAYIPERNSYLVTGKLWPKLFEVELIREGE